MKPTYSVLFSFMLLFAGFPLMAQKTGDFVEIFGKEKTKSIDEGTIIQIFEDGLALRNGHQTGLIQGYRDIVFWQMATGKFHTPKDGLLVEARFTDQPDTTQLKWEQVTVDSNGAFSDKLKNSVLYTSFESPQSTIALLDASGHTRVYINGEPHEGDHYEFGYTLIPFRLKKGLNEFVYTTGRFSRYNSKIIIPSKKVLFTARDMTLPTVLSDENSERWAAIRVINASEQTLKEYRIECRLPDGAMAVSEVGPIISLTARKVKFQIPAFKNQPSGDTLMAEVILKDNRGKELDRISIPLAVTQSTNYHERTFVSQIDGSVQYFSVAPSLTKADNQALVLSVHGASVEAKNQARAYKQKDWAHIVAPTNRRPFGFNWEEWGRKDALEVLNEARKIYKTNPQTTYLTGHSMGGHGTWYLGVTYPDLWGAIAPAAGYPDITLYRRSGPDSSMLLNPHFTMMQRGASGGRVLKLTENYLESGVYVLHGSADGVVSVEQARGMRKLLGTFHNNFAYYEYPGGSHWYGDNSVDWPPLFDFLKQNQIPATATVDSINFATAAPAIAASNYWIRVNQQEKQYETSRIKAILKADTTLVYPENIHSFSLLFGQFNMDKPTTINIDGQWIEPDSDADIHLMKKNGQWMEVPEINFSEKHPERQGGFKMAFDNHVVFVYATHGDKKSNEWYLNKARFDAETFWYRGNGSIDIIPDREFDPAKYKDRNVILYGNADNNSAWSQLLAHCPVKVTNKEIVFGERTFTGKELGTYFIYPRSDNKTASVGVVAGTGEQGMKALYPNDYFSGITGFPDLMIFDVDWIKDNPEGIKVSGFFGNDWGINSGDFKF
ncbi:MAG: alpha/beta hydrolase-fold protein [Lentimicrobium sp.]|nr:alpha/beta hydrolase-fold protein [Lentimicrobium sp.]